MDRAIAEMKLELRRKGHEYVKALETQAGDIDRLIQRMSDQLRQMEGHYAEELEYIEKVVPAQLSCSGQDSDKILGVMQAFLQERSSLLSKHHGEIEALFDRRKQREQQFWEESQARAEDYQAQLEALHVQDGEGTNLLKTHLETDVQNLEIQFASMQAAYQLNGEKLDYNYRVLLERDIENQHTSHQQKRKIAKLRESLSGIKTKYTEADGKFHEENVRLTDEYKKSTEQFKDLQAKYRHFQETDQRRYRDIWLMNQEIVTGLVRKLHQADKIIHEQQLGLPWQSPSEETCISPGTWEDEELLQGYASLCP
eukprot:scaffold724_cov333-Prasinococcus_capsulatus_cf.AAC.3